MNAPAPRLLQNNEQHRSPHEQSRSQSKVLEELERLRQETSNLREESQITAAQLQSLRSQLDKVKHVTSTTDICSDTTLVEKLKALNCQVCRIASILVDMLAEHSNGTQRQAKRIPTPIPNHVSEFVNQGLLEYLVSAKRDKHFWLECTFRAYLSHRLYQIVSSWSDEQQLSVVFENTYMRMREAGETLGYI